jgi:hypothetical protein
MSANSSFFLLANAGEEYEFGHTASSMERKKREQVDAARLHSNPPCFQGYFWGLVYKNRPTK